MIRSVLSRKWNFSVQVDRQLALSLVDPASLPSSLDQVPTKVVLRLDLSSAKLDSSGMLIAIKDLNAVVDHLLASLNSDHRVWRSLESILVYLKALFHEHLGHDPRFQMDRFSLAFENGLEIEVSTLDFLVKKDFWIQAQHSLETDAHNGRAIRHGHDMKIKVAMQYEVFKGLVDRIHEMSRTVQKEIVERYNNGFLNRYFPTPTGEVLTLSFFRTLKEKGLGRHLFAVDLDETARNTFKATVAATTSE